ncbi:MAG: hypothetical protein P8Z74_20940 [Acidobacteriota bacterium]
MNHFVSLVILSIVLATVFSLLNRAERRERLRYFFMLLGYMVVGSLIVSWIMYFLPF